MLDSAVQHAAREAFENNGGPWQDSHRDVKEDEESSDKNTDLDELKKIMEGNGDMHRDISQLSQVLPCMVAIVTP